MKKATGSFLVPMVLWVAVLLLAASCGTGSTATPRPTFTTPVATATTPAATTATPAATATTPAATTASAAEIDPVSPGAFFSLVPLELAEGHSFDFTDRFKLVLDNDAEDIEEAIDSSLPSEWIWPGGGWLWMGVMEDDQGTRKVLISRVNSLTAGSIRRFSLRGQEPETYRGVEYYQYGPAGTPRWVAFLEAERSDVEILLMAESKDDMERIIRHVDRGKQNSLWDEYGSIVDELYPQSRFGGAAFVAIEDCSSLLDGCQRWVTVWSVENSYDMEFEMRAIYGTDRDAERATTDTADLLGLIPYVDNVEALAEDNQVIVTGLMDIESALADDFFDIGPTSQE